MTSEFKLPRGRYLVTGGAGFVGSHLCERLLAEGNEVVAVDNFVTGNKANVKAFESNPKFSLIEHDITQPLNIPGNLSGIFHMASPASPEDYANLPLETLRVGSIGSDNVLKVAVEKNCPVLVASTSEIYGDPVQHPQQETYWGNVNPIGPRSCYDEAKRYLEALTMAYHRKLGAKTRIVRIFNTYGPRMRINDGRVVPNFCIQAISKQDLTVYGDGKQTRSFCYVDDLVDGLIRLLGSDVTEPVNLGNPTEMTILEFAERILKVSGGKSRIAYKPLPKDDPKQRKPDISRAKKLLNWQPKYDLEEGLAKTYAYFQSQVTA